MTRLPLLLLAAILATACSGAPAASPAPSAPVGPRTFSQDLGAYTLPAEWDATSGAAAFRTLTGEGWTVDAWMFVPTVAKLDAPTVFTYVEFDLTPLELCASAAGTVTARELSVDGGVRGRTFELTPATGTLFGVAASGVRFQGGGERGAIYCAVLETRAIVYQAFGRGAPDALFAIPAELASTTPVLVPLK
jgi:hypothetical protein